MQLAIIGRSGIISDVPDGGDSSPYDWHPIRGSLEAIARLHLAGWRVIVSCSHPELDGGHMTPDMMLRLHDSLRRRVSERGGIIDAIFYCPHGPDSACSCRMPAPGLLQDIARRLHIDLADVPVIGDSIAQLQAATAAGARPMLVKTGRGFGTVSLPELDPDVPVFDDLYSVTDYLLELH